MPSASFTSTPLITCRLDALSNNPRTLHTLIDNHLFWNTSYHICISTLQSLTTDTNPSPDYVSLVLQTRELALTLGYLYEYYLHVPREAMQLKKHADVLYDWLSQRAPHTTESLLVASTEFDKPDNVTRKIHGFFVDYNQPRLILTRIKRLLSTLKLFLTGLYSRVITPIEKIANPTLNYLAWLFFLPRFTSNTLLLLKHLIPHPRWMTRTEASLPTSLRLKTAFKRHWAELCNDSVWCASGVLGCFFLIGGAVPIASYVVGALYGYDVLISAINAAVELTRLSTLRDYYRANNYPEAVLKQLSQQIAYEHRRFALSITTNALLTAAFVLTLPFFAANPLLPLIGACLLLAFTIIAYGLSLANKKTNPDTYSRALQNHGIFQTKSTVAAPTAEPIDRLRNTTNDNQDSPGVYNYQCSSI